MRSALSLAFVLLTGCGVGLYQGSASPEDADGYGPPPPASFRCERGPRQPNDSDHDGKNDGLIHTIDGQPLCVGEDKNHDGKIDSWTRYQDGKVVEEARDTDHDGTLDEAAVDTNGDGSLDRVTAIGPRVKE